MNVQRKLSSNPEEVNNFVTFAQQTEKNLETCFCCDVENMSSAVCFAKSFHI